MGKAGAGGALKGVNVALFQVRTWRERKTIDATLIDWPLVRLVQANLFGETRWRLAAEEQSACPFVFGNRGEI